MTEQETALLVQQASNGGHVATEDLLTRLLPELRAFIRLRIGARIRARETDEDLAQSVCRKILEDLPEFEFRGLPAFKRWLFLRAQNHILDKGKFYARQVRDVAREEQLATNPQDYSGYYNLLSPSRFAIQGEEVERLERAFDDLPPEYAEVITLAKVLGLGHKEIGEEMDRSPDAARVLLNRALAKLGMLLTKD